MHRVRLFAGLLVLAAVVTTAWMTVEAERSSRAAIQRRMQETREVWETFQASHYRTLTRGVRVLANDAPFKAAIVSGDQQTVFDMLKEKGQDVEADFVLATNASGRLIARTDRPGDYGGDLSSDPMVAKSRQRKESASVWQEGDKLFHALSVPMSFEADLVGILVAGYGIDQAFADDLRKITQGGVAFFVAVPGAAPRLSVSSLDRRDGAPTLAAAVASSTSEPFEIELGGERHLGIQVPLTAAGGETLGFVVFLRNLTEERAAFARLRTGTVVASLALIGLSLIIYVVAGRMTRSDS